MAISDMESWEADLRERYPSQDAEEQHTFRDYDDPARATVKEFYRLNHTQQTYDFARAKRQEYLGLNHAEMGVWEAMEFLNHLVDDSDPDTDATQIEHLLQTAEGMRADGQPRWMILAGLVHDLGKILCLWGEPQWAVVGDTFPLGCAFSDRIVYPEFFASNPDSGRPEFAGTGIYAPGCGLTTWSCRGVTTSTSRPSAPTTCRRRPCSRCGITRSTRGTARARTANSNRTPTAPAFLPC